MDWSTHGSSCTRCQRYVFSIALPLNSVACTTCTSPTSGARWPRVPPAADHPPLRTMQRVANDHPVQGPLPPYMASQGNILKESPGNPPYPMESPGKSPHTPRDSLGNPSCCPPPCLSFHPSGKELSRAFPRAVCFSSESPRPYRSLYEIPIESSEVPRKS